jgi:LTXXQ motif family protein
VEPLVPSRVFLVAPKSAVRRSANVHCHVKTCHGSCHCLVDGRALPLPDTLKAACHPADVMTSTARLEAVARRLDTMRQAVKSVRAALEDFYATLTDEQKAQFEAIGPRRTS